MSSVLDKLLAKTGKTRAEIGLPEVHEIPPVPPPVARVVLPANASVLDKMLARVGKTRTQALEEISPFLVDETRFTLALRAPAEETERLAQVSEADLSEDQKRAYDAIFAWLNKGKLVPGQKSPKLLTLAGFAGCGKTTVAALIAQNFHGSVAFAAYTGKAAGLLRKKLKEAGVTPQFCGTLHSLMYMPVENIETGEVGWSKKSFLGYRDEEDHPVSFGLLIIDEASMLQDRVLEDLQAYGIRILAIGDHGQLPPVMGSGSLMRNPHLRLEKIHRQAESNPIIRLSACIRETGKLLRSAEDGDKIRFVEQKNMGAEIDRLFRGATEAQLLERVVLSYSNANRCRFNANARMAYFGKHESAPRDGDLCICLRNTNVAFDKGEVRIYNGLRGFMRGMPDARFPHKYLSVFDFAEFSDMGLANLEISRYQFGQPTTFGAFQDLAQFKHDPKNWWEVGGLFDYGYALTVHKSQGSGWSDVLVFYDRPGNLSTEDCRRLYYTAVTRASERLTVVY